MFILTKQEKTVILFLAFMFSLGLGVDFCAKLRLPVQRIAGQDSEMVKFNVNKVSLKDLQYSGLITKNLAQRIIDYRDEHGGFKELDDLKKIKGIGQYRYEKLKDIFFVDR